jgi:hypothetical protein
MKVIDLSLNYINQYSFCKLFYGNQMAIGNILEVVYFPQLGPDPIAACRDFTMGGFSFGYNNLSMVKIDLKNCKLTNEYYINEHCIANLSRRIPRKYLINQRTTPRTALNATNATNTSGFEDYMPFVDFLYDNIDVVLVIYFSLVIFFLIVFLSIFFLKE